MIVTLSAWIAHVLTETSRLLLLVIIVQQIAFPSVQVFSRWSQWNDGNEHKVDAYVSSDYYYRTVTTSPIL